MARTHANVSEYDESKWARAAAAAKDVIDLANATGVYKLYTAPYQSKGDNAYPATVRPPYHSVYSNKDFPEGWADIDPFASYRSIFNGDLYATENPELIFTRGNNALNDQVRDLVLDHLPTNAGGRNRHGLTIKQCDAYDMADGSSFNLETFLDTCEVDKRFVSEDEYNRGLYPQIRPRVWKEYANREPRFYASVHSTVLFGHWQVRKMEIDATNRYGTTEVAITEEKTVPTTGFLQE